MSDIKSENRPISPRRRALQTSTLLAGLCTLLFSALLYATPGMIGQQSSELVPPSATTSTLMDSALLLPAPVAILMAVLLVGAALKRR